MSLQVITDIITEVVSTSTEIATSKKPCHQMHNNMGMNHMNHDMNHDMGHNMGHNMGHDMGHQMSSKAMDHDMPGMKMCKMSMTFNSDYENLCILTDKLMVTTKTQLVFAMVGIVLLTFGYEYYKLILDSMQGRYKQFKNGNTATEAECRNYKTKVSIAYALGVGYSMIIMLLFMTFNTWIMMSVCIGAGLGHYVFDVPFSSVACH